MIRHFLHPIKFFVAKDKKFYWLLCNRLNIIPGKLKLYEIAFLHRSASVVFSDGSVVNNERLEYLGDAILDAVIADYLFMKFPRKKEGFLTQMRSKIVKRSNLDLLARKVGVDELIVSNTQRNYQKKHIYGDAFEALIGAVYLDKGYVKTRKYIINNVIRHYVDLDQLINTEVDYKSRIIEWGQKNKYSLVFETKEEYLEMAQSPIFIANIKVGETTLGSGQGKSKKEAEQNASEQAHTYVSSASFLEPTSEISPQNSV